MVENCDNCIYSGRPSYDFPCTYCVTAYGFAPSKWERIPTDNVDRVEVVRCKDCRQNIEETEQYVICNVFDGFMRKDDYCSYGERKQQ